MRPSSRLLRLDLDRPRISKTFLAGDLSSFDGHGFAIQGDVFVLEVGRGRQSVTLNEGSVDLGRKGGEDRDEEAVAFLGRIVENSTKRLLQCLGVKGIARRAFHPPSGSEPTKKQCVIYRRVTLVVSSQESVLKSPKTILDF
eukprot:684396-Amorphochlora_amoeboformis.AAC.2